MDSIESLSLTTVLAAINAWLAVLARRKYQDWLENRKFRHFRILVIGRIIHELDNIFNLVASGQEMRPIIRSSDLIVAALIDAGFAPTEVPVVYKQAVQDSRGRFGGLLGKLSLQFFDDRFVTAVEQFFEPNVRIGTDDGRKDRSNTDRASESD